MDIKSVLAGFAILGCLLAFLLFYVGALSLSAALLFALICSLPILTYKK